MPNFMALLKCRTLELVVLLGEMLEGVLCWAFDFHNKPWFQFLEILEPKICQLHFLKNKVK